MPHCAPRRKVPLTRRVATWQVADAVGWDSFAVGRAFKTICTGLDLGPIPQVALCSLIARAVSNLRTPSGEALPAEVRLQLTADADVLCDFAHSRGLMTGRSPRALAAAALALAASTHRLGDCTSLDALATAFQVGRETVHTRSVELRGQLLALGQASLPWASDLGPRTLHAHLPLLVRLAASVGSSRSGRGGQDWGVEGAAGEAAAGTVVEANAPLCGAPAEGDRVQPGNTPPGQGPRKKRRHSGAAGPVDDPPAFKHSARVKAERSAALVKAAACLAAERLAASRREHSPPLDAPPALPPQPPAREELCGGLEKSGPDGAPHRSLPTSAAQAERRQSARVCKFAATVDAFKRLLAAGVPQAVLLDGGAAAGEALLADRSAAAVNEGACAEDDLTPEELVHLLRGEEEVALIQRLQTEYEAAAAAAAAAEAEAGLELYEDWVGNIMGAGVVPPYPSAAAAAEEAAVTMTAEAAAGHTAAPHSL